MLLVALLCLCKAVLPESPTTSRAGLAFLASNSPHGAPPRGDGHHDKNEDSDESDDRDADDDEAAVGARSHARSPGDLGFLGSNRHTAGATGPGTVLRRPPQS